MKQKRKTDDNKILEMLDEGKSQTEIAQYFRVSPAAICKRIKKLKPAPLPASLENLTEQECNFAILRADGRSQTQAALQSYNVSSLESAKSIGHQLAQKPQIQLAISELMQMHGTDRSYRVKRLKQHVDNDDPGISLKALDQTWRLDGGYVEHHANHHVIIHEQIENLNNLDRQLAEVTAKLAEFGGDELDYELAAVYKKIADRNQDRAEIVDVDFQETEGPDGDKSEKE